jgi:hypothetical protein
MKMGAMREGVASQQRLIVIQRSEIGRAKGLTIPRGHRQTTGLFEKQGCGLLLGLGDEAG